MNETAFTFTCQDAQLLAILHPGAPRAARGILVVVGGPQYRVGSHRQFVLLARFLAAQGVPVLRFDHRGMGDSEGPTRGFEDIDDDIRAAVDAFFQHSPGLEEVILWGLCDAVPAIAAHACGNSRVGGMVLLNPWVHTEVGAAKAYLKHYYLRRLFSRDFWLKVLRGRFRWSQSLASLSGKVTVSLREGDRVQEGISLPERLLSDLQCFKGPVLLILSGDDLVAAALRDLIAADSRWRSLLDKPLVQLRQLDEANHTFACQRWRRQVEEWTLGWCTRQ